jgi:hypothetical protein
VRVIVSAGYKGQEDAELVTASEIAAFVYCPEAWRLEYGLAAGGGEPGGVGGE